MKNKLTIPDLHEMTRKGEKIALLTAYDYPTALIEDKVGIDIILVGDSLAMTVLGYKTTVSVTLEEMLIFTKAVTRAVERTFVVADMPFLTYKTDSNTAIINAGRFIQEGNADAVKLEGAGSVVPNIKAIIDAGIPVMGHIGLTPQSIGILGGFKVQGTKKESALKLIEDARKLEDVGVFSIIAESIPCELTPLIKDAVSIPVYGIGAGADADGQILVVHDILGLFQDFIPRFVKKYTDLGKTLNDVFSRYINDVKNGDFPDEKQTYHIDKKELEALRKELSKGSYRL
ncbi:MAG: 3-methyl-2-oxobutanoate hydroxymethyltransferase [Candidatus Cloacimonadota bacterium]|nr:MAG: 3-methyl-2-oxobutanoate hydroxymethyltransferase [Candidatus Cloacimonadota bacterium]